MHQLALQLALGAGLIVVTTAFQAIGIVLSMKYRPHVSRWLGRVGTGQVIAIMAAGALWMLSWQMAGVWVWALVLIWVGAFSALEPALYFTLASYTTLGFGDLLTPQNWRILGAVIGANGMLGFGLGTAALVTFVQGIVSDLDQAERDDAS